TCKSRAAMRSLRARDSRPTGIRSESGRGPPMRKPFSMRPILRRFAAVLVALATVLSLQPVGRVLAQTGQSGQSPADLSGILQNLTPEQQQAILDRLSGGGGSGLGGLLGGGQDQLGLGMRPGQQLERK